MRSIFKKLNTKCVSCNVLLNDKNIVKNRKIYNKGLDNIRNKIKKPIIQHVYENNTMIKTERTVLIGIYGCGKTFLMLSLLKDKNPDEINKICKTDNLYPSKYHNKCSKILNLEVYGNKIIGSYDMLGSKKANLLMLFLTRGRHQNLDIYYISQSWYELPKNTIRNNCIRVMLFPQTLKDITRIYNDISGLHMSFSERRIFCREAWLKRSNSIQIDEDKDLVDMYSIKNVSDLEIVAVPETTAF